MRFSAVLVTASILTGTSCSDGPSDPQLGDRVLWKHSRTGVNILPSMSVDLVYFGSRSHELVALDKSNGSLKWVANTSVGGDRTAGFNTVVSGEIVALGDIDVFAFDRNTGAPRWTFRPSDDDETGTNWLGADDQTIYAPSLWGRV